MDAAIFAAVDRWWDPFEHDSLVIVGGVQALRPGMSHGGFGPRILLTVLGTALLLKSRATRAI